MDLSRWLSLPWPPQFWGCCCGGAFGYTVGGDFGADVSLVCDKTDFAAESTAAVTTGNLSVSRSYAAGASNPDVAAYYAGGATTGGVRTALTDKLVFSNDTTSAVTTANLSSARLAWSSGLSERSTKAYFAGGNTGAVVATADKLTFSGDSTAASTSSNLTLARGQHTALAEGSTKGYWFAGISATAVEKLCDKVTFSTDVTAAATTGNLAAGKSEMAGCSDGTTKGFIAGGRTYSGAISGAASNVEKITFSTDTTSSASGTVNKADGHAMADGTIGLFCGAIVSGGGFQLNEIIKYTFATETSASFGSGADLSHQHFRMSCASTPAL